LLILQPNIIR